jgi:hypothetical protein
MARAVLCLVVLGISTVAWSQTPARDTSVTPTGSAVIRGRVTAAGAEHGLSKVEVRATASALGVTKSSLTDGDGRYEIRDLPAGRYTVAASKLNYIRTSYGERRSMGAGQPIDVSEAAAVERINFVLQRGGVITGRIVDEFGDPLPEVQVMPMRFTYSDGQRRPQPNGLPSFTDDLGDYRLFGLAPGQYMVTAVARQLGPPVETTDRSTYAPTYYPGTASISEAQRITVQSGQTVSSINMSVLPVTGARVDGTVVDAQGRPMSGGFVNAMQRVGGMGIGAAGGQIKPDGSFSIGSLAPGEYTLRAALTGMGGEVAILNVTLGSGDTTSVQLAAAKPTTIRGRLVADDGRALPTATAVNVVASPLSAVQGFGGGGFAAAKADGSFEMTINSIASDGSRVGVNAFITMNGPPSPQMPIWRVRRVRTDDADVTDSGLMVLPGATIDNVVIELTSQSPEIDIRAADASGALVRDCVIVVFASDAERLTAPQQRYIAFGRPDTDGIYKARMPAGTYLVAAFDDAEPNVSIFADPEILAQLRDRATSVAIGERERKSLDVRLVEAPVY